MKNNNEIRMAAQSIYRQLITLTANENNGCSEPTLAALSARMDKAVDWAIANGEFVTLRHICGEMMSTATDSATIQARQDLYEMFFDNSYIWGLGL